MAAKCEVVTFDPRLRSEFARLNYAWIEKHFAVEPIDRRVLEDPEGEILAHGGQVFFALVGDRVVGTVALKPEGPVLELTKMAVEENCRGRGYGQMLLDAALQYARSHGATRVVLSSHTSLTPAIAMYRKFGFAERHDTNSSYSRCNIYMECAL